MPEIPPRRRCGSKHKRIDRARKIPKTLIAVHDSSVRDGFERKRALTLKKRTRGAKPRGFLRAVWLRVLPAKEKKKKGVVRRRGHQGDGITCLQRQVSGGG